MNSPSRPETDAGTHGKVAVSRRRPVLTLLFAACVGILPLHNAAAQLVWNWSFHGTEAGTFVTDGTLADALNATPSSTFQFTIVDGSFAVSASSFADNIGATFVDLHPASGFFWDGSQATGFFRNSLPGTLTSAAFAQSGHSSYAYGLDADAWALTRDGFAPVEFIGSANLSPVPEPATTALFLASLAGLAAIVFRHHRGRHAGLATEMQTA